MSEKLKFIKATIFAVDSYKRMGATTPSSPMEIYLPLDAISHITPHDTGNPHIYNVHIKSNYPIDKPFEIKSISVSHLKSEQIELIK